MSHGMGDHHHHRGFLHVICHAAKGLPAADLYLLKKNSSDPYCEISFNGQFRKTETKYSTLNPVWEQPFSFQIGSFLPESLLHLLGEVPREVAALQPLKIAISDHDTITADDALGECELDLVQVMKYPEEWHTFELDVHSASSKGGSTGLLLVSVCWEPTHGLPAYVLRLMSVACYSTGFALLLISSSTRWQQKAEDGRLQQPGVGVTTLLGSGVMLLSTCLQFVVMHLESSLRLDDLVANMSAHRGLNDALASAGVPSEPPPSTIATVSVNVNPCKATQNIGLSIDFRPLRLPVVIVNWLLPFGGMALGGVALALQAAQDWAVKIDVGQICTIAACSIVAVGYLFALLAEHGPRVSERRRNEGVRAFRERASKQVSAFSTMPMKTTESLRKRWFTSSASQSKDGLEPRRVS